jgi:hypothetical protein
VRKTALAGDTGSVIAYTVDYTALHGPEPTEDRQYQRCRSTRVPVDILR